MRSFFHISSIILISGLMLFCLVGEGRAVCGELLPNESISRGESIVSCNGFFMLTMSESEDGFPVLYRIDETGGVEFLWSPDADSYIIKADNEFTLSMQDDGNLVLYLATASGSGPIWSSKTDGHPGAWLAVQNDGNLVVYDTDGKDIWASHTVSPPICSALFYPSNEWQRAGYDLNSVCLGYGQDESSLEFDTDWGDDIVAYERKDKIQLLSSRTIFLEAGTYTFTVGSDDGARLWIDDKIKIDQWLNRGYTTDSVTLTFKSDGDHKFRLDYFENTGGARLSFKMALVPPAEPEDVFCGSNQIGWGGYSDHLEFFQSVFCNNLDNLGYSDASVNESGRHLVDSADWGGDLFCGPNEVVCGGRDFNSSADAPLDMIWCCPINGVDIDQTSRRLVEIGEGVVLGITTCSKNEVLCGTQNCDDSNTALDKLWCCPAESIPAGGPEPPPPPPPAEECACVEELIPLPEGGSITLPLCSSVCDSGFAGKPCTTKDDCITSPPPPPAPVARFLLSNPLKWGSFEDLVDAIIKFLIMLSAPVAAIMFVIAGFYFVTSAGDPVKAQTGRRIMIYTAVGLAVILLASGLIKVLQSLLGGS